MPAHRQRPLLLLLLALLSITAAGCGAGAPATAGGGALRVVAAENFWASIAKQLAGSRGVVQAIIVDPGADPHAYQPNAADARTLANSELAIVNGVGYDPWAPRLLAANPSTGRTLITVGDLLHLRAGDNPHRWYSPPDVERVADAITAELKKRLPAQAAYFDHQRQLLESHALAEYHAQINAIRAKYSGTPVGASESIFALLAPSLGLTLITPPGYMKAVSEGSEPTAADKRTIDQQISRRLIAVWVYNPQNLTPDVQRLTNEARARNIPLVRMTETLNPASDTFGQWQSAQLQQLQRALQQAGGR